MLAKFNTMKDALLSKQCLSCGLTGHKQLMDCFQGCSFCGEDHFKSGCANRRRVSQSHNSRSFRFCYTCWGPSHLRGQCKDYSVKNACLLGIQRSPEPGAVWAKILQAPEARYAYAVELLENLDEEEH